MRLQIGIGPVAENSIWSAKRLNVSYMPLGDWPVAVRNLDAGAVGLLFLRALIGEQRTLITPCGAEHRRPRDCRPRRRCRDVAAAAMAPTPSSMAMIAAVCALASSARSLLRWPPAMWPVSWASTPIIWFGVSASISAPALMKMRLASTTKALKERSLMMTTWMFCCAEPGGAQDRLGIVAQQLLDLGVADHRQAAALWACAGTLASSDGAGGDNGDHTRWPKIHHDL